MYFRPYISLRSKYTIFADLSSVGLTLGKIVTIFIFALISCASWGQEKVISATRTNEKIKIDGEMLEQKWLDADIATHFLERNPTEGKPPLFRTEVRVLFDDENIYFLGYCHDDYPDSILTQLGERDDRLNTDLFSISIDTYDKKLDAFTFSVSASGVQSDSRISDPSFNAVWESAVAITEDGWIAEIKIPYYAIRFPKGEKQSWRVQFGREIRRSRTELQWSLVPKNVETEINFWGYLEGLDNIKSLSDFHYLHMFLLFQLSQKRTIPLVMEPVLISNWA